MKKVLLAATLVIGSIMYTSADAQVRVSINANFTRQPSWGPAGYDYAQFYYLPDINAYYDVQARQFICFNRGSWVYTTALPGSYRNYDLYRGYKVVMNEPRPYVNNYVHRSKYRGFKNYRQAQVMNYEIYDRRNDRFDHKYDGNDRYDHRYDNAKNDRRDRSERW